MDPGGRLIPMMEYVAEFGKGGHPTKAEGRLDAAAFHRNHAPTWEVRDISDLATLAAANVLRLVDSFEMPANSMMPMFVHTGGEQLVTSP